MNVVRVLPQTGRSLVLFSDGRSGVWSEQYDGIAGRSLPTGAQRLTKGMRAALARDELRPVRDRCHRLVGYVGPNVTHDMVPGLFGVTADAGLTISDWGAK